MTTLQRYTLRADDSGPTADPRGDYVEYQPWMERMQWQPIETAPRRYSPPLSTVNHHAPEILGLWGKAFYSICRWGGPSNPCWIGADNKPAPFQPTHWMPLPEAPR